MRRAVKKKESYILAYQLGTGHEMEAQLIEEGAIVDHGDGTYELFSQEAVNGAGQIAHAGDYFKVITKDGRHYPYPIGKKWFEEHHKPVKGKGMEDIFEQIILPVEFFKLVDDESGQKRAPSGTVRKLLDEQKLKIDESNPVETFTAVLDGAKLSVPEDGVVVIYGTGEDGSIDFSLMTGETFRETYREITCFNFSTRTKGISDTGDITDMKEKQRVYFTCHPDDFDGYFEDIRKQILEMYEGCAICFKTHPAEILDEEELEQLSDMSAFVIPVTEKFLDKESFARKEECAFAEEKGIPLLFWLEYHESDEHERLLSKFQEGEFKDKHFYDSEAEENDANMFLSEEKLKHFLSSCLLDDALLEKIKSSFGGNYIFLSYRRVDRELARNLMATIHKYDFCWDTAIWYDEFLVYGENFNDKINEILEKSGLFVLAVTPKLLDIPNYIQEKEYPAAKAACDKNKINILPVELEPTEWDELRKDNNYPGIEKPTEENDEDTMREKLSERAPQSKIPEQDADPDYLFYIGSAYLRGIDLEKDTERGVKLITKAAEKGSLEAMEQLARIYEIGEEGIERCYEKEIVWRQKIKEYWEKEYAGSPLEENAENLVEAYRKLGLAGYNEEHYDLARDNFRKMLPLAGDLFLNFPESQSRPQHCHTLWRNLMYMGLICMKEEKWGEAEIWYRLGMGLTEGENPEIGPEDPRQYRVYNYYEMGSLGLRCGEEDQAEEWTDKAITLCEEMYGEIQPEEELYGETQPEEELYGEIQPDEEDSTIPVRTLNNLTRCYRQRGKIEKEKGNKETAAEWFQKGEERQEERIRRYGAPYERKYLAARYEGEGKALWEKDQYEEAIGRYKKGYVLRHILAYIYPGTWEEFKDLADCCAEISMVYSDLRINSSDSFDLQNEKEWYEKALRAREEACRLNSTSDILLAELANSYQWGPFHGAEHPEKAEEIWTEKISPDFPNRERNRNRLNAENMMAITEELRELRPLRTAIREKTVCVEVFQLGIGDPREKDFIDKGLIEDLGGGYYKLDDTEVAVRSWISEDPYQVRAESFVAIEEKNGKYVLFPIKDKESLDLLNYSYISGDNYAKTEPEQVAFYKLGDDKAPVIQKLIDSGDLTIDESDPEKTFTATIGGKKRSVAKDGVVVIFGPEGDGRIYFDLLSAEEFKNEFTDITDQLRLG